MTFFGILLVHQLYERLAVIHVSSNMPLGFILCWLTDISVLGFSHLNRFYLHSVTAEQDDILLVLHE